MSDWGCCSLENGEEEEFIVCTFCKKGFHYVCLSLPVCKDNKVLKAWKCPQCSNSHAELSTKDSTPIRNINIGRGNKRPALNSPPASKPVTREDVQEIVQDVIRHEFSDLMKQLNDTITGVLNKELQPIRNEMKEISESMNFMSKRFDDIEKEQEEAKKSRKGLNEDNIKLRNTIQELNTRIISSEQRINATEQQMRVNNLEIQCVPENRSENLNNIVKQLGTVVGCSLNDNDIIRCTRIAKMNTTSNRPRSIVIQFASLKTRDQLLASTINYNKINVTNKLNSSHLGFSGNKTPIYVLEHLSPANKILHAATRLKAKEAGYKYVWIRAGKIFVRKNDESAFIIIKNMETLEKLK